MHHYELFYLTQRYEKKKKKKKKKKKQLAYILWSFVCKHV